MVCLEFAMEGERHDILSDLFDQAFRGLHAFIKIPIEVGEVMRLFFLACFLWIL